MKHLFSFLLRSPGKPNQACSYQHLDRQVNREPIPVQSVLQPVQQLANLPGKKCSFQLLLTNPFLKPISITLAVGGPLTLRGTLCPRRG